MGPVVLFVIHHEQVNPTAEELLDQNVNSTGVDFSEGGGVLNLWGFYFVWYPIRVHLHFHVCKWRPEVDSGFLISTYLLRQALSQLNPEHTH